MIPQQLSTNHLNRLAHFIKENMPLPQQSYKETKLLLKQLIKNLRKEIRVNLIGLTSKEIGTYNEAVYDFLTETGFIDYDRLLYFEHNKLPENSEEFKRIEDIRNKGISLELLKDPNPFFKKKKLDMCIKLIILFEEECLASLNIWGEFREIGFSPE